MKKLILMIAFASAAAGATLTVDDDHAQCPNAQYSSIQAAVLAAKPGDTINVCPGTYSEQVSITKNLTVQGVNIANQGLILIQPAVVAPNSTGLANGMPVAAAVLVDGAGSVNLSNLTVDASNNQISDCGTLLVGIYYRNSSGNVGSVAIRNVKLNPGQEGCNSGYAFFAQSGNGGSSKVNLTNSSIHDYQKNGIVGQESATQLNVNGNGVSGIGSNPNLAQNGIELAFGATGTVQNNLVINHIYAQCTDANNCNAAASNILAFQAGAVKITNNSVGKGQLNIALGTNGAEAANNFLFDSDVLYGVYAPGNNNKIHDNSIFHSGSVAVFVDGVGNAVQNNAINEAPVGVLQSAASMGTSISGNKFYNVGTDAQTAPPMMAASISSANSGPIEVPARP